MAECSESDYRHHLTRSCSFDSTFEQILPPEQWKIYLSDDSDIKRGPKLDRVTFSGFMDSDGRLVEVQSFRQAVFRGRPNYLTYFDHRARFD